MYNHTDHLGNVRVSYAKDPVSGLPKIVEESHYYPFGLKHANYNDYAPPAPGMANMGYQYKYNGQELQTELGLNMTAMDYRQYDNAIGRFNSMDALSELGMSMTPYQFGNNNPVSFSDPTGLIAGGNPFMNGLWNNSPDNKNTIWTNNGYGSFVNQSYTGMVDIQGGMYTDLTEVVNLPEISVTIRPGGSSIAGDVIRTHVYRNSPFYNYIWEQGRQRQLDSFNTMLDAFGLIPGIGEFADGLNVAIYAARGDKVNAAISAASMVPFLGWAAVSTKYIRKTGYNVTSIAVRSALADRIGKRGFSDVGYQFQKHFGRGGDWGEAISQGVKLNPATFNQAGYDTFKSIWKAPGSFQNVGGFIEKRLPDGRGIRLQENWKFKGFLD